MKNSIAIFLFGLLFLFFLQQITFLVESIYMLNLLHLRMDAKALGILFFFAPVLLLLFRKPVTRQAQVLLMTLFLASSAVSPWVATDVRILTSGVAVSALLIFLGLVLSTPLAGRVPWFFCISITAVLSLLFRTLGYTQDRLVAGQTPVLSTIAIVCTGLLFAAFLSQSEPGSDSREFRPKKNPLILAAIGLASCLALFYFAFASPTVLTRWSELSYSLLLSIYAISVAAVFIVFMLVPSLFFSLKKTQLVIWTVLFLLALLMSILSHTIVFPPTATAPVVIVEPRPTIMWMILTVLLSPIIYINFHFFVQQCRANRPSQLAIPMTIGFFLFSLLILMLIFTNVWGYVGTVSAFFRNKFYLPFLLAGLGMLLPLLSTNNVAHPIPITDKKRWSAAVVILACVVTASAIRLDSARVTPPETINQLTILSYNIQQGVDVNGRKNYANQLALIRKINPDIICLQESDVARISGGNSDVVRYCAQHLRYFSYYGPTTVTGTFGTAILSRFPMRECRTIFSYSDVDEIGTSAAEITIGDKRIAIFNSHPAGGPQAKQAHVEALLAQLDGYDYIIAAGDYNFRQDSPYYTKIVDYLNDSWLARWPDGVADISSGKYRDLFAGTTSVLSEASRLHLENRIDYIFLSDNFHVFDSMYLPVPASQSDHPAHWAVVQFFEE